MTYGVTVGGLGAAEYPSVGTVAGYATVLGFLLITITICARSLIGRWVDRPRDLDSALQNLKTRGEDLERTVDKRVRDVELDVEGFINRLKKLSGQAAREVRTAKADAGKEAPSNGDEAPGAAPTPAPVTAPMIDSRAELERRGMLQRARRRS